MSIIARDYIDRVFDAPAVKIEVPTRVFVSLGTKAIVSFYWLGEKVVICGVEETDPAGVVAHVNRLRSRFNLEITVIAERSFGYDLRHFQEAIPNVKWTILKDGIPFTHENKVSCLFEIVRLFAENRIRFDHDFIGTDETKLKMKSEFESVTRTVKGDVVRFTGGGDLFWAATIGIGVSQW